MINKFGSNSDGLGDVLLLTSVCKLFPNQITIQLPTKNERFSFLFNGLAKTIEITEDIIKLPNIGCGHYAQQMLRNFIDYADDVDLRPLTLFSDKESELWVSNFLKQISNPIIFVPNFSKQWHEVRSLSDDLNFKILHFLKKSNITPILCSHSSNDIHIDGVLKIKDLDLKKYTCLLRRVGRYIGCNTGDMHLAIATGCTVEVFQPNTNLFFNKNEWDYNHSTIIYNSL
jgi:hypothetical protein